jgi:hypothetical protein
MNAPTRPSVSCPVPWGAQAPSCHAGTAEAVHWRRPFLSHQKYSGNGKVSNGTFPKIAIP